MFSLYAMLSVDTCWEDVSNFLEGLEGSSGRRLVWLLEGISKMRFYKQTAVRTLQFPMWWPTTARSLRFKFKSLSLLLLNDNVGRKAAASSLGWCLQLSIYHLLNMAPDLPIHRLMYGSRAWGKDLSRESRRFLNLWNFQLYLNWDISGSSPYWPQYIDRTRRLPWKVS